VPTYPVWFKNKIGFFGKTKNLIKNENEEDLICGGSSGGSAVSVQTNSCFASFGSDTGEKFY
jgi:Asp-tRNA(Asn)/Glu-tRNA(Gln) amidotransferase A subunit family amidase